MDDTQKKKRILILDGNALVHRAFHALPPLSTKNGEIVNAVYGFLLVLFKSIRELQPDCIAAAFDVPGPTFRHEKFKEYKSKRPKAPEELYLQIPKIKDFLGKLGIPVFEKAGFEADDVIGTIAKASSKQQILPPIEPIIVTGDADAMQLVDENIKVYALRKGLKDIVLYDREAVKEKYDGLYPENLPDFKGLRGDPSDNIPGVTGIGEKTATELIKEFGSLENIYKELEENTEKAKKLKPSTRKKLEDYKDQAIFSKILGTIDTHVSIDFSLEKCGFGNYDRNEATKALQELEFYSLIAKLP